MSIAEPMKSWGRVPSDQEWHELFHKDSPTPRCPLCRTQKWGVAPPCTCNAMARTSPDDFGARHADDCDIMKYLVRLRAAEK